MYKIIIIGKINNDKYKLASVVKNDKSEFFWNSHVSKGMNYHCSLHKNGKHWVKETKMFKDSEPFVFGQVKEFDLFVGVQILFNQTFVKQYNLNINCKLDGPVIGYDEICEIDISNSWEQFIIGAGIFTDGYEKGIKNICPPIDNLFLYDNCAPKIYIHYCKDARLAVSKQN